MEGVQGVVETVPMVVTSDNGASEGDEQVGSGLGGGLGGASAKMRVVFDGPHRQAAEMRVSLRPVPKGQGLGGLKEGASTSNNNNKGIAEVFLPSHIHSHPSSSASSSSSSSSAFVQALSSSSESQTTKQSNDNDNNNDNDSSLSWAEDHLISADSHLNPHPHGNNNDNDFIASVELSSYESVRAGDPVYLSDKALVPRSDDDDICRMIALDQVGVIDHHIHPLNPPPHTPPYIPSYTPY